MKLTQHQVGLELGDVHIQSTTGTQRRRQRDAIRAMMRSKLVSVGRSMSNPTISNYDYGMLLSKLQK